MPAAQAQSGVVGGGAYQQPRLAEPAPQESREEGRGEGWWGEEGKLVKGGVEKVLAFWGWLGMAIGHGSFDRARLERERESDGIERESESLSRERKRGLGCF